MNFIVYAFYLHNAHFQLRMEHRTNDIDYLIGDAIENLMDKVERIEAAAAENYKVS